MSEPVRHLYEFGPFRLDPAERQLLRDGEEVALTPKSYAVLALLVRNSGRTLSKDDFMREVWPDTVVEEKNLADNISILRQALQDDARSQRYIKTVPRRGYRFVGDVREVPGVELMAVARERASILIEEEGDEPEPQRAGATGQVAARPAALRPPRRAVNPVAVAAGLLMLGLLTFVAYRLWAGRAERNAPAAASPIRSIAVLPFKPLVAVERDESLELGMADTLVTRLSAVGSLAVRPTSAVRKYTSLEDEAARAGRELGVDAVLDGSIQKAGDRVRVSVRLVQVEQGKTLWAEQFDEKFTDIFSVQDSIARRVVGALALRLSGEESERLTKRYTENTEAYRLYLTGRYFWNKRTAEGFEKAIDYYRQAIGIDPNYALAHAGLAETYVLLPNWTAAPPEEMYTRAEQSARRALELDPGLAEAYTALGSVRIYLYHDMAGGGADYRRATELNPNYATAHQWYGEWLAQTGRLEEAVAESAVAQRLDPLSPIVVFEYAVQLYYSKRTDEAEAQLRRVLELDPDFFRAHVFLSRIHFDRGQYDQSIRERALVFTRGDSEKAAQFEEPLRAAYRAGGREAYLRKLIELSDRPGVFHGNKVGGHIEGCALLGDKDCTFEWLLEAERVRHPFLDSIKIDPYLDFLRSDPRYAELLRKVGLE